MCASTASTSSASVGRVIGFVCGFEVVSVDVSHVEGNPCVVVVEH